jgi:HK97 family phage major capsid protein
MKTNDQHLTRIKKADMSLAALLADDGDMEIGYAETFLRLVTKKAKVMGDMNVFSMKEYKRKIPTIRFGGDVLQPGTPGQALPAGQRVKPDITAPILDAQLFKASVLIEDEVFEDNIEQDQLRNTILQLLGAAIARDTEKVIFAGDTTSATPLIAVLDGLLKQATAHVVDAGGTRMTRELLKQARRALPHEYKDDPLSMRIWTSTNAADDYCDTLGDRQTPLGDKHLEMGATGLYRNTPVVGVPVMLEDYGAGTNYTMALWCHPENAAVGFHKKVEIRTQEDIESGSVIIVARMRFDVKWTDTDGVVKITNLLAA